MCVLALLFSLAGQGSVVAPRPVDPVPIERPIDTLRGGRLQRTAAWWQAS